MRIKVVPIGEKSVNHALAKLEQNYKILDIKYHGSLAMIHYAAGSKDNPVNLEEELKI